MIRVLLTTPKGSKVDGHQTEIRDGMHIEWDAPIPANDGLLLRADVFRPPGEGKWPVILSYGPYGKLLVFGDQFTEQWTRMCDDHPDVPAGSTNRYQSFEVCDPEKFVPFGYAVVRVDSRGTGRSPGNIDPWSAREAQDLYDCIEWAGAQDWSTGRVGLNGISYLAMNQWQAAALRPPHLEAMCVWEGAADYYRDMGHHGGIMCTFSRAWYEPYVVILQNGLGTNGEPSSMTGGWVSGPETLTPEELAANRSDWHGDIIANPLATDDFWVSRRPDLAKIEVPLLSAGNWGGQGLHPRGNFEGFLEAGSTQKWLEVHGLEHWTHFYTDYGVGLQRRFFDYFLKQEDTGWSNQPKIQLQIRHPGEVFVERHEGEWPIARTDWQKLYLDPENSVIAPTPVTEAGSCTYLAVSDGVTFLTPPLKEATEVTGPIASKLFISSSTEDADLFLIVRVFTPDMKEVTFQGSNDPHTPIALGWLRASHRKLDLERSLEYRPYHTHDEVESLAPGEIYELDIEIWPTSIAVPAGYRIGLSIRGRDYEHAAGDPGSKGLKRMGVFTGVGPFRHDEAKSRPSAIFDNEVTLHCGPAHPSYLLLPTIPQK
jgi:predicted acyl esterase